MRDVSDVAGTDFMAVGTVCGEFRVVFHKTMFAEGDKVAYVPVDSVYRGKAVRARDIKGVVSHGMIVACPDGLGVGDSVVDALGLTKYDAVGDPVVYDSVMPTYTDIQSLRKYAGWFSAGEDVVVMEKIHGENFRAYVDSAGLTVGSRTRVKPESESCKFWRAAYEARLKEWLPVGVTLYGESCGYTAARGKKFKFSYGTGSSGVRLVVFDALRGGSFMSYDQLVSFMASKGVEDLLAPVLYIGPFSMEKMKELCAGKSRLGDHVMEGIVVRPVAERKDPYGGRCILKMHSDEFLLVK